MSERFASAFSYFRYKASRTVAISIHLVKHGGISMKRINTMLNSTFCFGSGVRGS